MKIVTLKYDHTVLRAIIRTHRNQMHVYAYIIAYKNVFFLLLIFNLT